MTSMFLFWNLCTRVQQFLCEHLQCNFVKLLQYHIFRKGVFCPFLQTMRESHNHYRKRKMHSQILNKEFGVQLLCRDSDLAS